MSEDELDPLGSVSRSKLHFFWMADCSGSMRTQGKIQALNNAIHECIPSTKAANDSNAFADMMVRAIRFSEATPCSLGSLYIIVTCPEPQNPAA